MKTILYSVFILLLVPCNNKKVSTTTGTDHSKLMISYQCTPCFGMCPTYTLTINGGTKVATFKGESNTEKIGTYTKQINDNELSELINTFETFKFNSMKDDYVGEISDFPMKIITYSDYGKTKTIKERGEAPDELISIERALIKFADSEGWKKTEAADH